MTTKKKKKERSKEWLAGFKAGKEHQRRLEKKKQDLEKKLAEMERVRGYQDGLNSRGCRPTSDEYMQGFQRGRAQASRWAFGGCDDA